MAVEALDQQDGRLIEAYVAGPAALLVAKLHKLGERIESPHRLYDKDAHDIYRLLKAVEPETLRAGISRLLDDSVSREVTREALDFLQMLFAASPEATGSVMAGRAEEGVGDPENVAVSASILAADLISSCEPLDP